jgi:hypothetical protein
VFGIVDYIYTELNNNKSIDENTIELNWNLIKFQNW